METSPFVITAIAIIIFLILIFNGMPIGFAFAIVGCIGLIMFRGMESALTILGDTPFTWGTALDLIPLPLFILMGQFVFASGISQDLYQAADKWVGRLPGGLALTTTLASTGFAACCGMSMAGALTMSSIAFPEMKKLGYNLGLATSCILAGGSLSSLIPPSVAFIMIGFLTETSIAKLFIGGILPGLMLSALFLISIFVRCLRNPKLGPPGQSYPLKEMIFALKGVWGMLLLFLLVIGGLYVGIFAPSEAGAAGAFGAFIIAVVTRRINFSGLTSAIKETMQFVCIILIVLIGVNVFNTFLATIGFSSAFSKWVTGLTLGPHVFFIALLFIFIILGFVMDVMSIIILTIPIVVPVLKGVGFDPVWVIILIVLVAELGVISPPFGILTFVIHGVTDVPLGIIYRGLIPFCLMMILGVALIYIFPQIALFLPGMMQ